MAHNGVNIQEMKSENDVIHRLTFSHNLLTLIYTTTFIQLIAFCFFNTKTSHFVLFTPFQ
jgi:hypothetical protein